MNTIFISDALSKALKRTTINRESIENFRTCLATYLRNVRDAGKEAKMEGYQRDFLRNTFYRNYDVTKPDDNNIDCAIRLDHSPDSPVAVIIENKAPENKNEMITADQPNRKAMQELVYYFLIERIEKHNTDLRHLIATNMYELFIFDAANFEKLFFDNNNLCREFKDFQLKAKTGNKTEDFYKIAAQYIDKVAEQLTCVYVDLHNYREAAMSKDDKGLHKLSLLYKLLSDTYMMKLPVSNDYNTLDNKFYRELLYIIGLQEVKQKGKPVLEKIDSTDTNSASLIDLTMNFVDKRVDDFQYRGSYGKNREEQLFNISMELCITWVNRLLFLRLLESQIIRYHNDDEHYRILGSNKIDSFQTLNQLFFDVLAIDYSQRSEIIKNSPLGMVPYLNSSLFELTKLERSMITISSLPNDRYLPVNNGSVLKKAGNPCAKEQSVPTLKYLLFFLDSYRFSSQDEGGIEDTDATLINASVLGLIFEKINGHKDGAVFTPAFITSAMSRPAVERAIIKKFNEQYSWNCSNVTDLTNHIDRALDKGYTLEELNATFNSVRIADISVGSGHFLVSVLGELIRLKFSLGLLTDTDGRTISRREYDIDMVNDELTVLDREGNVFRYIPGQPESQRIQETLFKEKRLLIENCLFGVDLNSNSVGICRLRLWIELLKNTYYTKESNYDHLQTLPNLDINIKQGDSLLSKYSTTTSLSNVLRGTNITIKGYKDLVSNYKSTADKRIKHQIEEEIKAIKSHLTNGLSKDNPNYKDRVKIEKKMFDLQGKISFYRLDKTPASLEAISKAQAKLDMLAENLAKIRIKVEDDKKKYKGSFEWRFEFPEILDASGSYVGFDLIIGNPPYIQLQADKGLLGRIYGDVGYATFQRTGDMYCLFIERACQLLNPGGQMCLITSNSWMKVGYGTNTRKFVFDHLNPEWLLDFGNNNVFENATVKTDILVASKTLNQHQTKAAVVPEVKREDLLSTMKEAIKRAAPQTFGEKETWVIADMLELSVKNKMESVGLALNKRTLYSLNRGASTGKNDAFLVTEDKRDAIFNACADEEERKRTEELIQPVLRGKDISRNQVKWDHLYLIALFPSRHLDIENYPAVKAHLLSFADSFLRTNNLGWVADRYLAEFCKQYLSQTGNTIVINGQTLRVGDRELKSRKKTSNKWFETQDAISYWRDFDKPKIVWGNLNRSASYAMTTEKYIINAPACIIAPASKALLHLLNSKLADWYIRPLCAPRDGGYVEYKPMFVGQLPIPDDISSLEDLTDEHKIDKEVFRLYGLTDEEVHALFPDFE